MLIDGWTEGGPRWKPKAEARWIDAHLHADLYPPREREAMLRKSLTGAGRGGRRRIDASRVSGQSGAVAELPGPVLRRTAFIRQPFPHAQELDKLLQWIRERHGRRIVRSRGSRISLLFQAGSGGSGSVI